MKLAGKHQAARDQLARIKAGGNLKLALLNLGEYEVARGKIETFIGKVQAASVVANDSVINKLEVDVTNIVASRLVGEIYTQLVNPLMREGARQTQIIEHISDKIEEGAAALKELLRTNRQSSVKVIDLSSDEYTVIPSKPKVPGGDGDGNGSGASATGNSDLDTKNGKMNNSSTVSKTTFSSSSRHHHKQGTPQNTYAVKPWVNRNTIVHHFDSVESLLKYVKPTDGPNALINELLATPDLKQILAENNIACYEGTSEAFKGTNNFTLFNEVQLQGEEEHQTNSAGNEKSKIIFIVYIRNLQSIIYI